jgi:hypothetical protein
VWFDQINENSKNESILSILLSQLPVIKILVLHELIFISFARLDDFLLQKSINRILLKALIFFCLTHMMGRFLLNVFKTNGKAKDN